MRLNDLTLPQLTELADTLKSLAQVGEDLAPLHPVFNLTPGEPARITLDVVMPAVEATGIPEWLAPQLQSTEAALSPADAPEDVGADLRQPEPLEAPSIAGEGVEGATHSAEPSRSGDDRDPPQGAASSEAEAESGGGEAVAAAHPPAAPVPGPASALAAKVANAWTEEDDRTVIEDMVASVTGGMSKTKAIEAAAKRIGRTMGATSVRFYAALSSRFTAALSDAVIVQAQTETPASPAPANATDGQTASGGAAAVGGHNPAAVQPVEMPSDEEVAASFERPMPLDPDDLHGDDLALWRFLQCHRPKWPMTAGTDLDLIVGLGRGDKLPELSADLGIDTEALKKRYQTLTSRILDTRGNVSIEGGPRLIKLLRRIAKIPAEAA